VSTKPAPVALTAAMLMSRRPAEGSTGRLDPEWIGIQRSADLASRLHRLAKGCQLANEHADNESRTCAIYRERIDKQVAKLSKELEPFNLWCKRSTYAEFPLFLHSTDPDVVPLPKNCAHTDAWGISA